MRMCILESDYAGPLLSLGMLAVCFENVARDDASKPGSRGVSGADGARAGTRATSRGGSIRGALGLRQVARTTQLCPAEIDHAGNGNAMQGGFLHAEGLLLCCEVCTTIA